MIDNTHKKPKLRKNLPFTAVLPELTSIILNCTEKSVIQKIYLFGSYAYGKPTKNSDLDICVILDNVEERNDIYLDISKALFYKDIIRCDLLVYKEREFYNSDNPESVEHTIMEKGELLYAR
jgi:predicted nucleotidyltransferase